MQLNPFDDDGGSFFVLVNNEEQHSLWPTFTTVPAGWRVVLGKPTAPHACTTSKNTGPISGRKASATRRPAPVCDVYTDVI